MAKRPTIVCLCGSTRFKDEFIRANFQETLAGKIVLTIGCDQRTDAELGIDDETKRKLDDETKRKLDELHWHKIRLADEVLILNVGGYIGQSTQRELALAIAKSKRLRFLEKDLGEDYMDRNSHELGRLVADLIQQEAGHE